MRVCVVGASGNVGTGVLRRLVQHPDVDEVVGIARRLPPPGGGTPYDEVSWHSVDVSVRHAGLPLAELFAGADAVVNLAWALTPSHDERLQERTNVEGSRLVAQAAVDAGVTQLVQASSVGAYAKGPADRHPVDESWPSTGIAASTYSTQKAAVERALDVIEAQHPELVVTRIRPALVMQGAAGSEIQRYFLGRFFPAQLLKRRIPLVPMPSDWRLQVVHADDVGAAFTEAVVRRAPGAFNIASDPVLTPDSIAAVLGGRHVAVPTALLQQVAALTWRARLQPTSPGWIDLAANVPLMDCSRAAQELHWRAEHRSDSVVRELVQGMAHGHGTSAPVLAPRRRVARG